jgi:predicted porin
MRQPCTLAVLLVTSGASLAQAVELYGIVDVGLRSTGSLTAGNTPLPAGRVDAISSGVDSTSRWGIKGQESLGGGWQALFRLEGGFNADTGAAAKSDRLFDRQAWVALASPYGTVALGRQPNLLSDALIAVDPLGKRFAGFNPNINIAGLSNTKFGTHAFGTQYGPSGYADNFYRLDNTLKYTASMGPWQARAAYSFGEVAGAASAGSSHGAALAYLRTDWAVSGAMMRLRSPDGLPLDAWSVGAMVRQAGWQFKANIARNVADTGPEKTVHQRVVSAGLSHPLAHGVLITAAWYGVRREATGLPDDGFDREFLFVEKTLAPRTTAYLEADYTTWHGDAAGLTAARPNDGHGAGLTLGLMHKF